MVIFSKNKSGILISQPKLRTAKNAVLISRKNKNGVLILTENKTAVLIFSKFHRADPVSVQQATDELFKRNAAIAHRFGFWSALLLYPFFGFLIATSVISLTLAFPIMGSLTAAAYSLSFAILSEWPSAG